MLKIEIVQEMKTRDGQKIVGESCPLRMGLTIAKQIVIPNFLKLLGHHRDVNGKSRLKREINFDKKRYIWDKIRGK